MVFLLGMLLLSVLGAAAGLGFGWLPAGVGGVVCAVLLAVGIFLALVVLFALVLWIFSLFVDLDKEQTCYSRTYAFLVDQLLHVSFFLARVRVHAQGLELVPRDRRFLLVSNHLQALDPEHHVQKQYLFWAAGTLSDAACAQLRQGVRLKGLPEPTRPARLELLATSELGRLSVPLFPARRALAQAQPALPAVCGRLWLTEGKRHQVKRMLEAVGCTAVYLKREAFGPLLLDDTLTPGQFRPLTEAEFSQLRQAAGLDNTP